ncbi:nicotinamide-nucleotide amidohydrolase family protein [Sphingobacterium siyangense]|uniref:CinA family protein n=1 Tax=Sphingobacterium siyangense TaxID=459529 RepID=UPI002FDB1E5C
MKINSEQKKTLEKIANQLKRRKERIAVAESVTSGFLQLALSQMQDASDCFAGGMTTYTIDTKVRILNVDARLAKVCNCVSAEITEQMAIEVANLFKTDWSIATAGYATPVPESMDKRFAFLAIVHNGQVVFNERIDVNNEDEPENIQHYYCSQAMEALQQMLS